MFANFFDVHVEFLIDDWAALSDSEHEFHGCTRNDQRAIGGVCRKWYSE